MPTVYRRQVRSFVHRRGRTTAAQRRALDTLFPRWGIEFSDQTLDLDRVYGRRAERVLDIGFGDGEALLTVAAKLRDVDFLGVEVHEPGIGHLLVLLEQADLDNVRIIDRDVVEVIDAMLAPMSFVAINIFFPDPWPKKRHHKRRLIEPRFVSKLASILRPGGLLHVATDCESYAAQIADVLEASPSFARIEPEAAAANRLAYRPPTKFERRGRKLGHTVVDLYYRQALPEGDETTDP